MSDFDRVKSALSIQDVICRESGYAVKKKHLEQCPFCGGHECFSIQNDKGFFKCFQCEEKGDVINFLQRLRGIDAGDALEAAAAMAGIALEKQPGEKTVRLSRGDKVMIDAAAYYYQCMTRNGGKAYFTKERGHLAEVCDRMQVGISDGKLHEHLKQLGYTFEEMVGSGLVKFNDSGPGAGQPYDFFKPGLALFPHMAGGRVLHFTMKDPKKETKPYQLTADKRSKNWRFYNQDALKYDEVVLVEGENDLLAVMDAGVYGVIGTSGQVQDMQIKAIEGHKRKRLFLWMDNDDDPEKPYTKGKGYVRKICTTLAHVPFQIIVYPETFKDPDEYLRSLATPAEKRKAVEALKASAVDYLSWEIMQADKKADLGAKMKHLDRFKVFQAIAMETEIRQLVYIEKLEALGLTRKGIEDQLDVETDIKKKLRLYMETIPKKADADPVLLSDMMFQYFKNKGRFFRTKKDEVFLLYKNKTYELSNNLPFNSLMMRTADLLPTKEPGRSIWCALANRGYSYGVEIQAANWLYTDPHEDTIFINLNSPNNIILKIGHDIQEIPNGLNDDNVLLRASTDIEPFTYIQDADVKEGFKRLHELFLKNLSCEHEQRYLIVAWMISAFIFDFSNMQILMKFSGAQASGKTTAARMVSILIYGSENVGSQSSASAFSEAAKNPLLIIDNLEQKNINESMNTFLLLAASKSSKTKRTAGTDSGTIKERPKSLVLTTAIEPFTLSELISRTCEIEFNKKFFATDFFESEMTRELARNRDLILSSILKVISGKVLPNINDRKNYLTILRNDYKNHAMDRNDEYLALLMVILKYILPYMPYYEKNSVMAGFETGETEIRRRWIEYQNDRSREMTTGSNAILKMLNGIVKDYLYEMREKNVPEIYDSEEGCGVFRFINIDYGLELVKTTPTDHVDPKTGEAFSQTQIFFTATATDIVYAFDAYCKKKGLKNIYSSAVIFGKRLENDLKVLDTENWTLLTKEGIFPYYKIVSGRRYYKFVNILIS